MDVEKMKILNFDELEVKDEKIQAYLKKLNNEYKGKVFEQKQLSQRE